MNEATLEITKFALDRGKTISVTSMGDVSVKLRKNSQLWFIKVINTTSRLDLWKSKLKNANPVEEIGFYLKTLSLPETKTFCCRIIQG